ncbi:Crp/Fnr family transcriptional regulator [Varunaivibrio sulfuroxidans]|uniref:Crp/Fnr family transcriptional regulator n=1 Tax=Varunaivibrio sulfuroxidans TaxID=1773489 RepID=A0A4R3JA51_9PROT|nr:cyclic nucleotide-binding domain-containing protein [Varunaivibrio sulfuroxidans]TCS62482.1 Crp/Fnr family transcriptional regulator [Varunaivibrio sulfuroxidans]WES30846.1 cyclic nucleotide-binding domain-containing protein [Varunaivibrio sulfuroxidans]
MSEGDYAMLRRLAVFAGLPDVEVRKLLGHMAITTVPRHTTLFLQGDPATRFYIIFEGWVKLYRQSADGHESVIEVLTGGESFAEAAIFDESVYPVSAEVVCDARLLEVPGEPLLRALRSNADLCLNIMSAMSRRMRQVVHQVEQITVRSSVERLALFLGQLAARREGAVELHLPIDKALIAARLGMQPETLSRSFSKLGSYGVKTQGSTVIIADVDILLTLGKDDEDLCPPRIDRCS